MKKFWFFLIIAVLFVGTVSAQETNSRRSRNNRQIENQSVTVNGTLKLERGLVAVASGDSVYYVPMLTRFIGFIDGLKEGTEVSVEGYQNRNFIRPAKVTLNGKSYDFPDHRPRQQMSGNFRPGPRGNNRGRYDSHYNCCGYNRSGYGTGRNSWGPNHHGNNRGNYNRPMDRRF